MMDFTEIFKYWDTKDIEFLETKIADASWSSAFSKEEIKVMVDYLEKRRKVEQ